MIAVIVFLDQIVWRPIIVWADKFKFEQVESSGAAQTTLLNLIGRASIVLRLYRLLIQPVFNWLNRTFTLGARRAAETFSAPKQHRLRAGSAIFLRQVLSLVWDLPFSMPLANCLIFTGKIIGIFWRAPRSLFCALTPRSSSARCGLFQWASRSVRVPAWRATHNRWCKWPPPFPPRRFFDYSSFSAPPARRPRDCRHAADASRHAVVHSLQCDRRRHGHSTDLKEAAQIYRFGSWDRWRHLILPGIFPYLVTGMVTASGGAWNASIVAEYFHFQGKIVFDRRTWQRDQQRQRFRPLRCTASFDSDYGDGGRSY